ncbi:hypothetical protein BU23DRAFT_197234 [Bimuria novae-zelandiae CBS 107.79]|uniref:Uncharacterized protein n=1 Tax=Bimuria novae-zelandiae CBS 107.79 TaxID=1447943 RepID=A0A6A5V2N8_9PLEO|nr:hypothetical protein BU23DRAFT_197234 [Bimuria novae-zelandiae CBS 107.79]
MAAATAGYEWNRSSPLRSSPDTASPMYPDRPIRPLPKRRLRDRMSPEQAETIIYPPNPPSTGPLFSFPYSTGERVSRALRQGESDHHTCHCGHNHSEPDSEEEEGFTDEHGAPLASSPSFHYGRPGRPAPAAVNAYRKPGSASSSVDGYESFENTSNKKKRKIPNMGGASTHPTSLSADMASMGISHPDDVTGLDGRDASANYYASAPSTPQHNTAGTGISGAGRGRFGRTTSGRPERRILVNSTNMANAKASSKRPSDQQGIISTAIANAQATPPHTGNENVSLLQQEAAKPSANKTQFTFTCGSDSAKNMAWPGQENGYPQPPGVYPTSAGAAQPASGPRARPPVRPDGSAVNQGTQTSPPPLNGSAPQPAPRNAPSKGAPPNQQAPPPRKPRRSAAKLYAYAARKRRIEQEYQNFHNPPDPVWICEFCEYEDIFGRPPEALIRKYEKKDREERKRLAEKRRLLEKARMKGRKGKKVNKKAQQANNAQTQQNPPTGDYNRRPENEPLDGQDDDYYDDDYDAPAASSVPRRCDHPGCHHHHHPAPVMPPGEPRVREAGRA